MKAEFFYVLIFLTVVLFVVLGIKEYFEKLSSASCGTDISVEPGVRSKTADRNVAHYPFTVQLSIDGMVCHHCAEQIESALNSLPGIWAKADLSQKSAIVYAKSQPDLEQLRRTVNGLAPYKVTQVTSAAQANSAEPR